MDRLIAREYVREAIISIRKFYDMIGDAELEILGGLSDFPTDHMGQKEAARVETIEKLIEEHTNNRPSIDDIILGRTIGTSDDEINDDTWIDSIIDEIIDNFRGVPILNENDNIVPFEP